MVAFEKCDASWSTVPCKSEQEIADWMIQKYIAILSNRKYFVQHEFGSPRMESSLELEWFTLNPRARTEYIIHVER